MKDKEDTEKSNSASPIPPVKALSKDDIIQMLREEIAKKDKIIEDISRENRLLLELSMKNAKRKLEELEALQSGTK